MRKYLIRRIPPDPNTNLAEFDEISYQEKHNCKIEQKAITYEDGYLVLVYEVRDLIDSRDFSAVAV
jgi:hypothetical protein